jgi:hypothetical protein
VRCLTVRTFAIPVSALLRLDAATALRFVLGPLAVVTPSAEALVAWVITSEMAVPNETFFLVATEEECYLFVKAHLG